MTTANIFLILAPILLVVALILGRLAIKNKNQRLQLISKWLYVGAVLALIAWIFLAIVDVNASLSI